MKHQPLQIKRVVPAGAKTLSPFDLAHLPLQVPAAAQKK